MFDNLAAFTLAAWIRPASTASFFSVIAKPHGANTTANSWQLEIPGTTQVRVKLRNASLGDEFVLGDGVLAGSWQHVAATSHVPREGVSLGQISIDVFDASAVYIGGDSNAGRRPITSTARSMTCASMIER